ncbi:MAG TPA: fused MFS/spermidine synthase [Candidatus Acidoferrum sp.]|nr:fused MFS/spermidine synthase [Candidatus Acidoferrum sp.]
MRPPLRQLPWTKPAQKVISLHLLCLLLAPSSHAANQVFEATSAYHHIRVVDDRGIRTLFFDDAMETRMSLQDPSQGHFEYTEYFQMPWLWNTQLTRVLMIGLGGGSTQRAFERYYPDVSVQSVDIDPIVVQVAHNYFGFVESERQKVATEDGRMFLRRSQARYDLIILDAYVQGRYGSSIPQHLATKEFFELARDHLNKTNGIVAYNVIGNINGWRANVVGALYRTLKSVFPQVYAFPAATSQNVVLLATTATVRADLNALRQRAAVLIQARRIISPGFLPRLDRFQPQPPPNAPTCPVLTDDFAPVEGLAAAAEGQGASSQR